MVGATWLADSSPYSIFNGTTQDGIQVGFGGCRVGPAHIATSEYLVSGTTLPDCAFAVIPQPTQSFVQIVDCDGLQFDGIGGTTFINSALPCDCGQLAGPAIGFSLSSLDFGGNASTLPLSIFNIGAGTLSWSATPSEPWLSVNPSSGVGDQSVNVTVDRTGLPLGDYSAELLVTGNTPVSRTVPVTMTVASQPNLSVDPTVINLSPSGLTATGRFNITNTGSGVLQWSLTTDKPWIEITGPTSGSGAASVTVGASPKPTMSESGTVTVNSNGGTAVVEVNFVRTQPPGVVGLYSDPEGLMCNINDVPGLVSVYVVHTLAPAVLAVQFSAPVPACMTGVTYLGENSPFQVVIGNTQTDGVAIGYGTCLRAPVHILTIQLFGQGLSQTCCPFTVLPDPDKDDVIVNDCTTTVDLVAIGGTSFVNPDASCNCSSVGVEESTWGHIKALYSDPTQ